MRGKHQLQIPSSPICLGDTAVRIYGTSLWNKTSNITTQYHLTKCHRKQLKTFYISNLHRTKIRIQIIAELLKRTRSCSRSLPDGTVSTASNHVFGCQIDEFHLPWLQKGIYHLTSFVCTCDHSNLYFRDL